MAKICQLFRCEVFGVVSFYVIEDRGDDQEIIGSGPGGDPVPELHGVHGAPNTYAQ